jgi:uncharacterized Zn finger protein (UPF0148 family)
METVPPAAAAAADVSEILCSICLVETPDYVTSCGHLFHQGCIQHALLLRNTCPNCRCILWRRTTSSRTVAIEEEEEEEEENMDFDVFVQRLIRDYNNTNTHERQYDIYDVFDEIDDVLDEIIEEVEYRTGTENILRIRRNLRLPEHDENNIMNYLV